MAGLMSLVQHREYKCTKCRRKKRAPLCDHLAATSRCLHCNPDSGSSAERRRAVTNVKYLLRLVRKALQGRYFSILGGNSSVVFGECVETGITDSTDTAFSLQVTIEGEEYHITVRKFSN